MDYTPNNPTPLSPSDYSGVSQAASDLRSHSADSVSDFAATQAHNIKAAAVEEAQNFRNYAGEKAAAIKGEDSVKLQQGKEKAKELHANAEDYVKENPTKAVLGAVGIGVIIGLILRR